MEGEEDEVGVGVGAAERMAEGWEDDGRKFGTRP
jgi:hypothetical protein